MSDISGVNNALRITGMATGLDTDNLIKQMISAEQMKVDKVKQDKQLIEWKQEAYVDIIKDLKKLTDDYLSTSGEKSIMKSASYSGSKVTSNDESIATATTSAGVITGLYKIKVDTLAEGAKKQSVQLTTGDGTSTASTSTKMSELDNWVGADFNIKIKVNGNESEEISIADGDSISDFINNIYSAKVTVGSEQEPLMNYVQVNFSELTGKLTIQTRDTGSDKTLEITGDTANFESLFGIVAAEVTGVDAEAKITAPGEAVVAVTKSSNSFTIDGITYNLHEAQDVADAAIELNITPDASAAVDRISEFLDEYNKIVAKVNDKVEEKKEYGYKPLTEEQEEGMTEDEIEKWEEMAKKGILKRDNNLESMLSSMRSAFFDTVEDAGMSLSDLGLSTSKDTSKRGQIVFVDSLGYENKEVGKAKLKEALESRGDQVMNLFIKSSDTAYSYTMRSTERQERYNEEGIFQRIKDIFTDYSGSSGILVQKSGYENTRWATNNDLSKKVMEKDKLIKEMNTKLYEKQERYYQQFARLEQAMNQLNAQSNWLNQQLGM